MTVKLHLPRRTLVAFAAVAAFLPGLATAKCGEITGKGDINIVGSSMPSVQHIAKEMETCSRQDSDQDYPRSTRGDRTRVCIGRQVSV